MSFDSTTDPTVEIPIAEQRTAMKVDDARQHADALAAYDKAYLPIRSLVDRLPTRGRLTLEISGDDAQALMYLCELGLIAAGVDPDRGAVGG